MSLLSRLSFIDGAGIFLFGERRAASAAVAVADALFVVVDLEDVPVDAAVCLFDLLPDAAEVDTGLGELVCPVCGGVWARAVAVISKAPIINLIITFFWFVTKGLDNEEFCLNPSSICLFRHTLLRIAAKD